MIITMIKFGQFEFPHFFGLLFFSSVKKCGKLQIDIRPTKLREFKSIFKSAENLNYINCVKKCGTLQIVRKIQVILILLVSHFLHFCVFKL